MSEKYLSQTTEAKRFIKNISRNFTPDQAVLVSELEANPHHATGEHYTFSCRIPEVLRETLEPISKKLSELDSSLLATDPAQYHITVFWCGIEQPIEKLISLVEETLNQQTLSFELHGLVAAHYGISVKVYPQNDMFLDLRTKLFRSINQELPQNPDGSLHEKAVSTWITLARYSKPPQERVIQYVNSFLDTDFGTFIPDTLGAYISHNKYLHNPTLLKAIKNHV